MEALDRLGWAAALNVVAYGVRLGIRTNRPEVLDQVAARLPPGWRPSPGRLVDRILSLTVGGHDARRNLRRYHLLYSDASQLSRTHDLEELLRRLEEHLQLYVAEAAPARVFVHAGVVGWQGRALLLPGASHAGKSTLVAALLRAGAVYYSDEYAVLDGRGRVHPYSRALQCRTAEGPQRVAPQALGAAAGSRALPVALVAALSYERGARWRPRRLSPGRGLLEILAHTVPARNRPRDVLATLQPLVSAARVVKGRRGEAAPAAEALLAMLDALES